MSVVPASSLLTLNMYLRTVYYRGIFRTQSNIYQGIFKKNFILDIRMSSKYASVLNLTLPRFWSVLHLDLQSPRPTLSKGRKTNTHIYIHTQQTQNNLPDAVIKSFTLSFIKLSHFLVSGS